LLGSVVLSAVVLGSVLVCFVVLSIAIVADSETMHHDEAPYSSLQKQLKRLKPLKQKNEKLTLQRNDNKGNKKP